MEAEDLHYFDSVDDDETLLFVVISQPSDNDSDDEGDGNGKAKVGVNGEDVVMTDNDADAGEIVNKVDCKNDKEKVTVYSLCVPRCFHTFISCTLFSNHLNIVKLQLKKVKSSNEIRKGFSPSFSMLCAMHDGFSAVFYSRTHLSMPCTLHKSQGLRLVLAHGMLVLFNGHLVHSGGCSRLGSTGNFLNDKRLFSYIWTESKKTAREDATQVYRSHIPLCHSHGKSDLHCDHCKNGIGTTFDFSNLDISHLSVGDKICGNLDYLGWVVVKAPYVGANLGKSIDLISSSGVWTQISNHCAFMKFTQDSFNQNFMKWRTDEHVVQYFKSLERNVLNIHLPSKKYVIGYRNILCNYLVSQTDQIPHCDYHVPKRCVK